MANRATIENGLRQLKAWKEAGEWSDRLPGHALAPWRLLCRCRVLCVACRPCRPDLAVSLLRRAGLIDDTTQMKQARELLDVS